MPKGFTDQEKELIRKRLLEQGYKLFSAFGIKKTNVEELARAAGISKGAFYDFYISKEALFMDVIEQVEARIRIEILKTVDLPGESPRLRLLAVLKKAFVVFQSDPILRYFSGADYEMLVQRVPEEKLIEHMQDDQTFFNDLVEKCRKVGIEIKVPIEQISGIIYPLVQSFLNENTGVPEQLSGNMDILLELVAAYCLGEVTISKQP